MHKRFFRIVSTVAIASAMGTGASAQQANIEPVADSGQESDSSLEEIVVTAQRRAENLQRTPLAITAVAGAELTRRGVLSVEDLPRIAPSLQISASGGPFVAYTIRGITAAAASPYADPAVAVNYNQVYLATPSAAHGLYFDLERVEVLKGPQGTLYGRNATAGAINIIPKRPDLSRIWIDVGVDTGNYGLLNGRATLNLPVSSTLAVRLAGQTIHHSGYFSDGTGDEDGQAARLSILFEPSANFSINLVADYARSTDRGGGATVVKLCNAGGGPCFFGRPWVGLQDQPEAYLPNTPPQTHKTRNDSEWYGVSATIKMNTGLGTLEIIPAYRESSVDLVSTVPGFYFKEQDRPHQTSLEARFTSQGSGAASWLVGGYYLNNPIKGRGLVEISGAPLFADALYDLAGWSVAAFGQLGYAISSTVRVTAGARYTYEKKTSDSAFFIDLGVVGPDPVFPPAGTGLPVFETKGTRTFRAPTWKLGAEWDVGPNSMIYASAGTGFKAGGFYHGPPGANSYDPEEVTAFTMGSKNRFLDNRLQVNAEAFAMKYSKQQLSYVKPIGGAAVQVTENIGDMNIKGIEIDTQLRVTPRTLLALSGQYLDTKYDDFGFLTPSPTLGTTCQVSPNASLFAVNCSGKPALRAPRWTIDASVEHRVPLAGSLELVGEIRGHFESSRELDIAYVSESRVGPAKRIDASITIRSVDQNWSIQGFVQNLTDEATINSLTVTTGYALNGVVGATLRPPRSYGIRLFRGF